MENSTTTGTDYVPDAPNCGHCSLDTAGTHEAHCPLYELQRLARAKALERAKAKVLEWETPTVLYVITGGLPWWMP